jgi:hypothetical protein
VLVSPMGVAQGLPRKRWSSKWPGNHNGIDARVGLLIAERTVGGGTGFEAISGSSEPTRRPRLKSGMEITEMRIGSRCAPMMMGTLELVSEASGE